MSALPPATRTRFPAPLPAKAGPAAADVSLQRAAARSKASSAALQTLQDTVLRGLCS